jgi:hypothetical protein
MQLDHERLDVYGVLLNLVEWCEELQGELRTQGAANTANVLNYLDRAALSALLNTA